MDSQISNIENREKKGHIRDALSYSICIDNQYGLKRDQLHELMTEVFILGYLRSKGRFHHLSQNEVSSLCHRKMNAEKEEFLMAS